MAGVRSVVLLLLAAALSVNGADFFTRDGLVMTKRTEAASADPNCADCGCGFAMGIWKTTTQTWTESDGRLLAACGASCGVLRFQSSSSQPHELSSSLIATAGDSIFSDTWNETSAAGNVTYHSLAYTYWCPLCSQATATPAPLSVDLRCTAAEGKCVPSEWWSLQFQSLKDSNAVSALPFNLITLNGDSYGRSLALFRFSTPSVLSGCDVISASISLNALAGGGFGVSDLVYINRWGASDDKECASQGNSLSVLDGSVPSNGTAVTLRYPAGSCSSFDAATKLQPSTTYFVAVSGGFKSSLAAASFTVKLSLASAEGVYPSSSSSAATTSFTPASTSASTSAASPPPVAAAAVALLLLQLLALSIVQ